MRRLKQAASVMFAAGLAAIAGWSSTREADSQTPQAEPAPNPSPTEGRAEPTSLDIHLAIAREVPGFGGYVYDPPTEKLKVFLKEPAAERDALAASLGRWLYDHPFFEGADITSKIEVVQGQYNFADLENMKWAATKVLSIPGVEYVDANEARNRLEIGITTPNLEAQVEQRLVEAGIAREAVVFRLSEAATDDLSGDPETKVAGLQIQRAGAGTCTLGFSAKHGSVIGFVTNAHCTPNIGEVDGAEFHQPLVDGSSNFIGVEEVDPAPWPGSTCPGGTVPPLYFCRLSDAIWARYQGVLLHYGYIARPQIGSADWNEVDLFRITEFGSPSAQCVPVRMVGKTTGHTFGNVTNTWVNRPSGTNPLIIMVYQHRASYQRAGGDSGGPVFGMISGNDVRLHGMHWTGGSDSGNQCGVNVNSFAYFSDITMIMDDLDITDVTYSSGGGGR